MHGRAVVRELSLACPPPTLPAHRQSERRPIDRPSYWSPAAAHRSTAAPLNKPCCRCPAFVAEYTHSTICMLSTARWRPTKRCPMPHAPKLDRRHACTCSTRVGSCVSESLSGSWNSASNGRPTPLSHLGRRRTHVPATYTLGTGHPDGRSATRHGRRHNTRPADGPRRRREKGFQH
jgi:hypothetical protein